MRLARLNRSRPGQGSFSLHSCQGDEQLLNTDRSPTPSADYLSLVYELLDAHGDTMHLARELEESPPGAGHLDYLRWGAHLDYLRDLQRVGREALARMDACARP